MKRYETVLGTVYYTIVCSNECLNRYVSVESRLSKRGEHKGLVGNDIKCLWRNNKVLISCALLFSCYSSSLFYSSSSSCSPPRKINTCTWSPQVLLLFRLIKSRTVTVLDSVTSQDLLTHDVIFKCYCYLQQLACCLLSKLCLRKLNQWQRKVWLMTLQVNVTLSSLVFKFETSTGKETSNTLISCIHF